MKKKFIFLFLIFPSLVWARSTVTFKIKTEAENSGYQIISDNSRVYFRQDGNALGHPNGYPLAATLKNMKKVLKPSFAGMMSSAGGEPRETYMTMGSMVTASLISWAAGLDMSHAGSFVISACVVGNLVGQTLPTVKAMKDYYNKGVCYKQVSQAVEMLKDEEADQFDMTFYIHPYYTNYIRNLLRQLIP